MNVLCRRAIYRFVYLLVTDGERKGLAGVKRWMRRGNGICGAVWFNCIFVLFIDLFGKNNE